SATMALAIENRGEASLCLAGGETPGRVYQQLSDSTRQWRSRIDWTHVRLFWGDERNVPPSDPESNFGLANRTLIQAVRVPAANVNRIRGELTADEAGRKYDALLRARRAQLEGALFDVMLLGIGANAHIASLFPGSPLLRQRRDDVPENPSPQEGALAAGVWVPELNQWRITLTASALLDSNAIIVMAVGSQKSEAIAAALEAPPDVSHYPAQLLRDAADRL